MSTAPPLMRRLRDSDFYQRLRCRKQQGLMHLDPRGRESLHKLGALKDAYSGERCFILGNGPSLRQTDLSPLRDQYTFGLNRIYLLFPKLGFHTSFLVAINLLVLEQVAHEILSFAGPLFVPWSARSYLPGGEQTNLHFLLTGCPGPGFSGDARRPLWSGYTVTFVALQLAFHMGFKRAILVGVDHSFSTQGPANSEVTSEGDDSNHFDPGYFGKGFRWQLPDLQMSEVAYRLARERYAAAGREVVDATVGGKLQVFPKVDYTSLF